MLFISEKNIIELLTIGEVIESVRVALRDYSHERVMVPSRVAMDVRGPDNSVIFLSANYLSMPYYGLKHAATCPGNAEKGEKTVLSDIHLYCADTGKPLAVLSANHLTAMKTGAAAAVATDLLARTADAVLAIVGAGVQARTQAAAIQEVRPIRELRVFDLDRGRAQAFAEYIDTMKNRNYTVTIADTAGECVSHADIVSTCTPSATPVISGDLISEGTHINAIGSFTPRMQEIDAETVAKADKIVTDSVPEAMAAAGDLLVPLERGQFQASDLYGELGDIVAGKIHGRENQSEITLYESVGFAALDIAVAVAAYRKAESAGLGLRMEWE